jgi:hypothetical protein
LAEHPSPQLSYSVGSTPPNDAADQRGGGGYAFLSREPSRVENGRHARHAQATLGLNDERLPRDEGATCRSRGDGGTVSMQRGEVEATKAEPIDPLPYGLAADLPPLGDLLQWRACDDGIANRTDGNLDAVGLARQCIAGENALSATAASAPSERYLQSMSSAWCSVAAEDRGVRQREVDAATRGTTAACEDLVAFRCVAMRASLRERSLVSAGAKGDYVGHWSCRTVKHGRTPVQRQPKTCLSHENTCKQWKS